MMKKVLTELKWWLYVVGAMILYVAGSLHHTVNCITGK